MLDINDQVHDAVKVVVGSEPFEEWLEQQSLSLGDLILINNSFVYRDIVDTTKSDLYLAVQVEENQELSSPYVVEWSRLNSDFKHISGKSNNLPRLISLDDAIETQLNKIGELPFVLVGSIDDTIILEVTFNHSDFEKIVWDPAAEEMIAINDHVIRVSEVADETSLWQRIEESYEDQTEVPANLRNALGDALDELLKRAEANLVLPTDQQIEERNLTSDIVRVLETQRDNYKRALNQLSDNVGIRETAINEVLRIAYAFSSDATNYLRLVISICDLKPIVLWGTIDCHLALATAFRSMPWTSSKAKPSIKSYTQIIGDARNSAFHDLFPFRKTLKVKLPPSALRDVNLTFFSEYTNRSANELSYTDKELVEVLLKFTRARERKVTDRFWTHNFQVMEKSIELFEKTGDYLTSMSRISGGE